MNEITFKATFDKESDAVYIYFTEIAKGAAKNTLTLEDESENLTLEFNVGLKVGLKVKPRKI